MTGSVVEWMSAGDALDMLYRRGGRIPGPGVISLEVSIAQLAFAPGNRLRTKAASLSVEGQEIALEGSDGFLPSRFWEPDAIELYAKGFSNWHLGIVAGEAEMDGRHLRAIAHGVMFCRDDLERLTGVGPRRAVAGAPIATSAAPVEGSDRSPGGRPSDKHGEPIAAVTIKLMEISEPELQSYTGDSLGLELAAAYKAIGAAAPSGKNLEGIAWGILRAVRAAKAPRV